MKKLLIILTMLMAATVNNNAQIYSKILYLDKFDDVIKTENIKTLITYTDSSIIIEEKGRKPVEYLILEPATGNVLGNTSLVGKNVYDYTILQNGTRDNIVDLTGENVYGYETGWLSIKSTDRNTFDKLFTNMIESIINGMVNENEKTKLIENVSERRIRYHCYLIHRTISKFSFEFQYDTDTFWVMVGDHNNNQLGIGVKRIAYMRD